MVCQKKSQAELLETLEIMQKRISELEGSNIKLKKEIETFHDSGSSYKSVVEDLDVGYFEADFNGNLTFANNALSRIMGYSAEELIGINNREYTSRKTSQRIYRIFKNVFQTGKAARVTDYEIFLKGGGKKTVDIAVYLKRDAKGNPIGFFGFETDVTERMRTEKILRKSEERYRTIIETIEDGYYETDLNGNFTFLNDSMCRIAGGSREELIGLNNRDYASPETAKNMYLVFSEVYRTGKPAEITDYEVIRPDGARRIAGVSTTLMRNTWGEPVGFCGIVRDLTDKRKMERLYETVAEQSFTGIYVIRKGKFLYINARAASYAGYTAEDLTGKNPMVVVHPDDREAIRRYAREMLKGKRSSFYEYRMVTKTGDIRWIIETVTPVLFEGEWATLGSSLDITDRKKMEDELRASEIRYRTIIENTGTAMLIVEDDMSISMMNSGFEDMVGYSVSEVVGKKKWTEFISMEDVDRMMEYHRLRLKDPDAAPARYEFKLIGKGGRTIDIFIIISIIQGTGQTVASLIDMTERKKMEETLRYMGTHDKLTGLYNRGFFEEEMARLERGREFPVSVVMMDVDGLKGVNDNEGHKAGDDLLKRAARVLRESFRTEDTVARVGGDEFAVILPKTDAPATEQTIQRVRRYLVMHNMEYPKSPLSLSIGAATGNRGDTLSLVQGRADRLMYEEKMTRKGLVCRIAR